MTIYCWRCGTANSGADQRCAKCGVDIGPPPIAERTGADVAPVAAPTPVVDVAPVADDPPAGATPTYPEFVWHGSEQPADARPLDPAPPSVQVEPSTKTPRRSPETSRRRALLIVLIGAVILALVAVGVLVGLVVGQPSVRQPPPDPGLPPFPTYATTDCGLIETGPITYYTLGNDRLPTFLLNYYYGTVSQCRHDTATSVDATYALAPDQWGFMYAAYTFWLQQYGGFTAGPLGASGGYLWGRSTDAGQWLLVGLLNDPEAGMTVSVRKGPRAILPDGLVERTTTLPDAVSSQFTGATMSFTPARGWAQYAQQTASPGEATNYGLHYNKIVGGSLVGSLGVFGPGVTNFLAVDWGVADDAMSFLSFMGEWAPGAPTAGTVPVVVDGCQGLQATWTEHDTVVRFEVVRCSTEGFAFIAEVDASKPALLDEVQKMIDSARIS